MNAQNIARTIGVLVVAVLLLAIAASASMNRNDAPIDTTYGERFGRAAQSVNGTSVLAEMFAQTGATVATGTRLSPRLARSQTIVWAPNSFELPSTQEIRFFNQNWLGLNDGVERTLIYIARDYEGAIEYYRTQAEQGAVDDFVENTRRKARSQSDHAYMRALTGTATECDWFSIEGKEHFFEVQPESGPWLLDAVANNGIPNTYPVSGILVPPETDSEEAFGYESRVLLGADETPLVLEVQDNYNWPYGRVLILLNGSSLLNYPLVNHENRRLAAKLIETCNSPGHVTFLESGPGGLYITQSKSSVHSGFGPLTVWPINAILLHLVAAGILFCMMVFPIFGRPREQNADRPNDFGKHVDAIRRLFEISDNRQLAIQKVNEYRQLEADSAITTTKNPDTGNPFKASEI